MMRHIVKFLLLVLVLGGWLLTSCSAPEPPKFELAIGNFTCLVMTYPEEGNFDEFEFVTKKYQRTYWRPVDEDTIRGSTPSRLN